MATLPLDLDRAALPVPGADALAHSIRLQAEIDVEIERHGGAIPFERYMELALYAPGLGYYSAGARKFGADGDFVTAPEISCDFGRCVARALRPALESVQTPAVLEFGAGTGRLALDLLRQWSADGTLPARYLLLEPSADLAARQQALLAQQAPELRTRCHWLDGLPEPLDGVVIANEVLDAMPVTRFRITDEGPRRMLVRQVDGRLAVAWDSMPDARLDAALAAIESRVGSLPVGFESEINLHLAPWLRSLSDCVRNAVVLLIDYGYPVHEYYHADRRQGTLICHYRHRVHDDPLLLPGLQDITASVDFSAVASAAVAAGFAVAGYTTQAAFLLDAGLEALLADSDPEQPRAHLARTQGIKRLVLPGEMGERFKVLALSKGVVDRPAGFGARDLSDRL